ncbi:MAG: peptide-methionine (S)-S-oxide reductase MsrA [Oscillospiraceae bacterium]|nr:peptide-methionine (S)-S-oxide reductase MsrA [Oscillospiraceae bacterium]
MTTAYFAGGCFWCMTPAFAELDGVRRVTCGYSGGQEQNPTYEAVKSQSTGHRESIAIDYDPEKVSFSQLLELFLENVDPFDDGGQFIDRGHSYTLAVYYRNEAERERTLERLSRLEAESGQTPCISVEPFDRFFDAEDYHQDYYRKNPEAFQKELEESGRWNRHLS